jgi:hypothetical protein
VRVEVVDKSGEEDCDGCEDCETGRPRPLARGRATGRGERGLRGHDDALEERKEMRQDRFRLEKSCTDNRL